jgi:16S rRNA (uracil1498-N3)-methyltransferase
MARLRRFRVESLQGLTAGNAVSFSAAEARHIHVLRLSAGTQVELADGSGTTALAELVESASGLGARLITVQSGTAHAARLILATAWPKGKRAAWLVEKSSELGVDRIVPVRYARSVVHKTEESESLARLRRIAAEAAKQCGRKDEPQIAEEHSFAQLLSEQAPHALALLLDAHAEARLADVLRDERVAARERPALVIVGPEGGMTPEELAATTAAGIPRVRLARHILRVETAALAACAVVGAMWE